LGHGAADLCSGALWSLLPFLVVERHYSYAAVGVFALVASLSSALLQPLFGAQGDRREAVWLLPVGLIVGGLGIAAVGLMRSYPLTLAAVAVCSAGVAAYHPEGARWARLAAGSRITSDMSIFSLGGGVGYALGPLLVAAALVPLGLKGTLLIPLVPLAAAAAVSVAVRRLGVRLPAHAQRRRLSVAQAQQWQPFARLLLLYCAANGVGIGLLTYVPLFLVHARSTSPGTANIMTSVLLAAAAAGTLLGGLAAQRLGRRFVLVLPQLVLAPAIALLPSLSYGAMIPLVIVIGVAMNTNMSIALVLAQEYLPARMGLATGLTVGLCGGAGGLIVAALGLLGDSAGPAAVLYVIAALPLVVAAVSATLPQPAAAPPETLWGLHAEVRG
jgi:FSR family fosmidomycin resistance protein-like MFS transporter